MRRKSIMLFLCVALTGSLLTGCGDTKKEQKTEQNKKTEAVDNKSEQTAEEEQTQTPDDMTEIQETAQATKKPVQTPTARKKDNKSVKATDTPRPSDAVEPRDMMTFSAKVENSCEKMTIKLFIFPATERMHGAII